MILQLFVFDINNFIVFLGLFLEITEEIRRFIECFCNKMP